MRKINIIRLIFCGVVAGVVLDVLSYLVNGLLLDQNWSDELLALGRNEFSIAQLIQFDSIGIFFGIATIFLYIVFRETFGANWKTAVYVGVTAWVIGVVLPNASLLFVTDLFSKHLIVYTTAGGLVEVVAGTVAGAYFYKPRPSRHSKIVSTRKDMESL
jgi:hypothetical protein